MAEAEAIRDLFELPDVDPRFAAPRYNIAPSQPILIVRRSARREHIDGPTIRELVPARWGLLPSWVKDPKDFPLLINARAEGVAEKPSFRNAFRRRRCLIPASGFYEWQARASGPKQPYWIRPEDGSLIAFAGLWECWAGPNGEEIDTAAIITTDANSTLRPIHNRMPVVLQPDTFETWLETDSPADMLQELLRPAGGNLLRAIAISTRVNRAGNDDPDIWTPLADGDAETD